MIKRYLSFFILILISTIQFLTCIDNKSKLEDYKVIISTDIEGVADTELQRIEKEVKNGLRIICQQLDICYSEPIYVKIIKDGNCHTFRGIVHLPIWHVRNKKAAIIHEITHIINIHNGNNFFSEGLAVCFQEKYGEDNAFPNFDGLDLDELVKSYKNQLIPLTDLYNNNYFFLRVNTEQRRIAYIEAGSFTNFILKKYGNEKLKELHNSFRLDYKAIYGKSIKELEIEWKNHIFN